MENTSKEVTKLIKDITGATIPVYDIKLFAESIAYVVEAMYMKEISNGIYQTKCIKELKELTDSNYIILTNNGTAATHLVAKALHYKYPEVKRIAVPSNVYVAAWNAFLLDGYFELVPIDADFNNWNINIKELIARRDEYDAVLIVHNLGNVVDVPFLKGMLKDKIFVEDACEALAHHYVANNSQVPSNSFAGSLSFYGNKLVTSGEGGAFVTNDKDTYEYIKKFVGQGQSDARFKHDMLGVNYRMSNLNAAFLYSQLIHIKEQYYDKKLRYSWYADYLIEEIASNKIRLQYPFSSKWMFGFYFEDLTADVDYEKFFLDYGIETRPMFYPINEHGHLKDYGENFPVSRTLSEKVIIFPSYPFLSKIDVFHITNAIKEFINVLSSKI